MSDIMIQVGLKVVNEEKDRDNFIGYSLMCRRTRSVCVLQKFLMVDDEMNIVHIKSLENLPRLYVTYICTGFWRNMKSNSTRIGQR